MLKLHYFPGSCAFVPHVALEWSGLPYQAQAETRESIKEPAYLKLNPLGQVPLLEDDGWTLTQNVAIVGYIHDLAPKAGIFGHGDTRTTAKARQWLSFANSDLHRQFSLVFGPARFVADEAAQQALAAGGRAAILRLYGIVNDALHAQNYLAGELSIADIYVYTTLRWARTLKIDFGSFDRLDDYSARIDANPGVQSVKKQQRTKSCGRRGKAPAALVSCATFTPHRSSLLMSFLQSFFFEYGYYAVFSVLVLCGMGLPLPEDITLVTAGIISALGEKNVHIMLVVAYFGVLCGDWMMYIIGWKFGPHLRKSRWFSKLLTPKRMLQTETLFLRYGNRLVFIARFLPGLRAPIYVMTGITRRISFWQFTLMDGLAALLSIPIFVYIGFYGAENSEWMMKKMHEFKYLTIALFIALAAFIIYYLWRRKRRIAFFRATRARLRAQRKENKPA